MPEIKKSDFSGKALSRSNRFRFMGLNSDDFIRYFFGGNAFIALLILALITLFLFKEGAGFFGQYQEDIEVYQKGGLQYVDIIGEQLGDYTALKQYFDRIRDQQIKNLADEGMEFAQIRKKLEYEFEFAERMNRASFELEGVVKEMRDIGRQTKQLYASNQSNIQRRDHLLKEGKADLAASVSVIHFDEAYWKRLFQPILDLKPRYLQVSREFEQSLELLKKEMPTTTTLAGYQEDLQHFRKLYRQYIDGFPEYARKLDDWQQFEPVSYFRVVMSFLFGKRWLTGTTWHEFYGILPLFSGSMMIAMIAISIAVPFGVGAAIYVNQIAGKKEQAVVKPYIEFVGALPSVVLGFFGIMVLGAEIQQLFGLEQRLNAFVAGCLLALMAIPTIFTLTEDALNNVPNAYKEASLAMGATRFQTTIRVIVPTALSAIISAILLGFGRVIGETMVVLLVAGNRIQIPDFGMGPAVIFEPVHTMTGIIAQELPEVVNGSIHYRALFMVGIVLFLIALLVNYIAQKVIHRFKQSAG